ncbi:thermosome subunit alpha [Nanoarchaeota archaeon]
MAKDVQPIFIMPEGTQRTSGKTAQRNNIMAAKLVAETVRTTLGPKGMDKMLVDSLGDIVITNDGVTILNEMQIEHPAAKMLVEVAKTQEAEVGDGTTTAVVLAGELLKNAELLLEKNIHSTIIAKGYRIAKEVTQKILDNISEKVTEKDLKILKQIASTAMTGKGAEHAKDKLSGLAVRAVLQVMEKEGKQILVNKNSIKLEKKVGGSVDDSQIIEGVVLDKEKVHPGMPRYVKNAKIALLDSPLEIKNTEIDSKIQITDPSQVQQFIDVEEKMIKEMANKVLMSGATVVFCQKGIDDLAQHYLAKNGIYACRRVKKSDMAQLANATGAKIITNLADLSRSDLGRAGLVEEKVIGDEEMTYVQGCVDTKSVTLLIRGGTEHIVAEAERAMEDAIGDLSSALISGKVVGGAGAPETEVARNLRLFANSLDGREQLAVLAFADSIEVIPITLAENAGLDPIDVLTDLKAAHDKGKKWAGINVFSGKVIDAWKSGIMEPLKIKTQAVSSAAEVAEMILRIDDVIAGGTAKPMPQGMPPGMPDMGGMM